MGEAQQALSGSGSGSGSGYGSGGSDYFPIVTTDGSSGVYISVGYLWNGYINGGTFHALTLSGSLDSLDVAYSSRVTRVEYCRTLKCIMTYNYAQATSATQAAMLSAWGSWCTAVNPEAMSPCG